MVCGQPKESSRMSSRNPTERARKTHEEFTERAYVAASRRGDRSIEARIESARRASEIHKRRTGRALKVTEADVLEADVYEEEEDELPLSYLGLQLTHRTTNVSDETIGRFAAYLRSRPDVRSLLDRAIAASRAMEGKDASCAGVAGPAVDPLPTPQSTPQAVTVDLSLQQAFRPPPPVGPSLQGSASYPPAASPNSATLPSTSHASSPHHAYPAQLQGMGTQFHMGSFGHGAFNPSYYGSTFFGRRQTVPALQNTPSLSTVAASPYPASTMLTPDQYQAMSQGFSQQPSSSNENAIGSPMSDATMFSVQTPPAAMTPLMNGGIELPASLPHRRMSMPAQMSNPPLATSAATLTLPCQEHPTAQNCDGGDGSVPRTPDNKRKATSELSRDEKTARSVGPAEVVPNDSDDTNAANPANNPAPSSAAAATDATGISDITMPTASDDNDDFFDFSMPRHIQELLLAPEISMFSDAFGFPGIPQFETVNLKDISNGSLKPGTGNEFPQFAGFNKDSVMSEKNFAMTDAAGFSKFESFEPGNMDDLWTDFFSPRAMEPLNPSTSQQQT
ncbi:hypothetical protein TWF696_004810 [Orbilia brochopaga]|uniref:Uncharacterized protein n=1 Tax=Orbilia brochopaga TaxID=3140254 RepID=A0AAV9UYU9_9PEZI